MIIESELESFRSVAQNRLRGNFGEKLYHISLEKYKNANHGNFPDWIEALKFIRDFGIEKEYNATSGVIKIGQETTLERQEILIPHLKALTPWRKGPFNIAGIYIDTEWRSDWKWDRVKNYINLKGKKVLDIGCGSGYHLWRMQSMGSSFTLGIEPYLRFCMQFHAIKSLTPEHYNVFLLPLTLEELPLELKHFDTIFSMGVLYHRKAPFEHLQLIRNLLNDGGELILETMIVDGDENCVFTPENRYAKMHNVFFIPSVKACIKWLKKCGFCDIEVLDITKTTIEEQRNTSWMDLESLPHFLNPNNPDLTIENEPAPVRAIFKAKKSL